MKLLLTTICLACLLFTACGLIGSGGTGGMKDVFAEMESGVRNNDENLFKKHWTSAGYDQNLVGRSGLEGNRVFSQGSRKKWFLKPDYSKTISQGKVEIYQCEIYSWEKDKKVDEIFLAVDKENSKVLGGGEDLEEVKALAEKFNSGKTREAEK